MTRNMKATISKLAGILFVICSVIICNVTSVQAAANPTTTVSKKTIYVDGSNYQVKLMNNLKTATVTYKSSDAKIATVTKKGVIAPVKKGTATITVTIKQQNKTYTSKIAVTVANPYISVKSNPTTIEKGKSKAFTVKVVGLTKTDIKWTSSNPSIVKVDAKTGKITGVKAGNAVIVATDSLSKKKSSLTVTVKNAPAPTKAPTPVPTKAPEKVKIESGTYAITRADGKIESLYKEFSNDIYILEKGETYYIKESISPVNATESYTIELYCINATGLESYSDVVDAVNKDGSIKLDHEGTYLLEIYTEAETCLISKKIKVTADKHTAIGFAGNMLKIHDDISEVISKYGQPDMTYSNNGNIMNIYKPNTYEYAIVYENNSRVEAVFVFNFNGVEFNGEQQPLLSDRVVGPGTTIGRTTMRLWADKIGSKINILGYAFDKDMGDPIRKYHNDEINTIIHYDLTNMLRVCNGLSTLSVNSTLVEAAKSHTLDMNAMNKLTHVSSDGTTFANRLRNKFGVGGNIAENVSAGYDFGFDSVMGFYNSQGHRTNTLNPIYSSFGISVIGAYTTVDFQG